MKNPVINQKRNKIGQRSKGWENKKESAGLSESMENYMEAISHLEEDLKVVRVKHIAGKMKVKMSSVSSALGVLQKKGLVKYVKYDSVELTANGQKAALLIRRRHSILKKFLTQVLDVGKENAEKDSCGMEHHISVDTVNNIVKFMEFIEACPRKKECVSNFKVFLKTGKMSSCE
ncbi:MAG: metal-dependent transcriptional regulator [Spirochaetota bacterium]